MVQFTRSISFILCVCTTLQAAANDEESSKPPDSFRVQLVDSDKEEFVTKESFAGKVIVLEFWATWCGPCRPAMQKLSELSDAFDGKEIAFLGISDESIEIVSQFLKNRPVSFPVGVDRSGNAHKAYEVTGIPHCVLIDRKGKTAWIGNPAFITHESLSRYLKTGEVPDHSQSLNPADKREKSQSKSDSFKLEIDLQLVQPVEIRGVTGFSSGYRRLRYQFESTKADEIFQRILGVSSRQLRIKDPLDNKTYTGEVRAYILFEGRSIDRSLIAQMLASAMGLKLVEETESLEVLVLRRGAVEPNPVRGMPSFRGGRIEDLADQALPDHPNAWKNARFNRLLSIEISGDFGLCEKLSEDFEIPVVDETGLSKKYNFLYTHADEEDIDPVRLSSELGLLAILEVRELTVTYAVPTGFPDNN